MDARAHTNPHAHTLTVKVNGPAIRPDSTVLYYHGTETTLRLDLLWEQMTTAVSTHLKEKSQDGKLLLVCLEDFRLLAQPSVRCKNSVFFLGCL